MAAWCRSVGSRQCKPSHKIAYLISPKEECERAEGPGKVELLDRLVPLCWEQTISRPSHRIAYLSSPEEECERAESPCMAGAPRPPVPLCWEQTSADRHTG